MRFNTPTIKKFFLKKLISLFLIVVVKHILIADWDDNAVFIEKNSSTGELKVINSAIDSTTGEIGINQIELTDPTGLTTGTTLSGAGPAPQVPPTCSGVWWDCVYDTTTHTGTGWANAECSDPNEGDWIAMVTWEPQFGDDAHITVTGYGGADNHIVYFNHDKADGVTIWPTACDNHGNCYTHLTWCTVHN